MPEGVIKFDEKFQKITFFNEVVTKILTNECLGNLNPEIE